MDKYKDIIKRINYYERLIMQVKPFSVTAASVFIDKIENLRSQLKEELKKGNINQVFANELLLREYMEYVYFIEEVLYKPIYSSCFRKYLTLIKEDYESIADLDVNQVAKNKLIESLSRVRDYYKNKKRMITNCYYNSAEKIIEKLEPNKTAGKKI